MPATKAAPCAGDAPGSAGCSEAPGAGCSHDTVGNRSCSASYSNCPTGAVRNTLVVQGCSRRGVLEVLELREHAVRDQAAAVVVVLPAHSGRLEPFGVGRPPVGLPVGVAVVGDRPAVRTARVDRPGLPVQPVRPGRAQHRGVVPIADGERIGQRELERDVLAGVVAHHVWAVGLVGRSVGGQPVVQLAAVPGLVLHVVLVRRGRDLLGLGAVCVEVERQQIPVRIHRVRLVEHRSAGRQRDRVRIVEAGHSGQGPEVVVERAILLHQYDDVLDVAEPPGSVERRSEGFLHAVGQQGGGCAAGGRRGGGAQETAATEFGHERPSRVGTREHFETIFH